MKLCEIGEFGLLERIRKRARFEDPSIIGIGDDCAVIHQERNTSFLLTTDLLIERVHFLNEFIEPRTLGRKSLAVNISDIAAMGGHPLWALISIAIPERITVEFCDELFIGVKEMCSRYSMKLIGGDTTSSRSDLMINVTVIGECETGKVRYRSGARTGDIIFLTGTVGSSSAGLNLMLNNADSKEIQGYKQLIAAHNDPEPEIEVGRIAAGMATSMIDVSDGVIADITHICDESRVGARIEVRKLPIDQACKDAARLLDNNYLEWALSGGEDYRLLITVPKTRKIDFMKTISAKCNRDVFEIGVITEQQEICIIDESGKKLTVTDSGWNHFTSTC